MTHGWEEVEDELSGGDIHIHDKFQFELKSEYVPFDGQHDNQYSVEFYLFIPSTLQINNETYTKTDFYQDQTSLIRFKTPAVPLSVLITSSTPQSPLYRIEQLYRTSTKVDEQEVLKELKLFANVARSALRLQIYLLEEKIKWNQKDPIVEKEIQYLCSQAHALHQTYLDFQERQQHWWQSGKLEEYSQYVDEFLSLASERYLAALLELVYAKGVEKSSSAATALKQEILYETRHRQKLSEATPFAHDPARQAEYLVYRQGLLKKFVLEVLFLSVSREDAGRTLRELAAAFAAGLAMFLYLSVFSYYSPGLVLNSSAILIAVLLYVLKDRIKETLKNSSAKIAARWMPDYTTKIQTPDRTKTLGILKEFFTFLADDQVPKEIWKIRNTEFHTALEQARRLEEVMYYRKDVRLFPLNRQEGIPLRELNDIFRYNISHYLAKASDAYKEQLRLDPETEELKKILSPKVYHINIIIRETFFQTSSQPKTILKKYRVVLDKEGIKRLEKIEQIVSSRNI